MLYVLRADGSVDELVEASFAKLDEKTGDLVCFTQRGAEIARYAPSETTAYSSNLSLLVEDETANAK